MKRLLPFVAVAVLLSGCTYHITSFAQRPAIDRELCSFAAVEAGKDDPDVDTLAEVGVVATTAKRVIDGNCNGEAVPFTGTVQVKMLVGRWIGGEWYQSDCYTSTTVGTNGSGSPLYPQAGFYFGDVPRTSLCEWIIFQGTVGADTYFGASSYHTGWFGQTFEDGFEWSGWEEFNP